jgi:hypothetical protein
MRRPEGHDWIGIGLFVFGFFLAAAGAVLVVNGEPVIGVFAIAVAAVNVFVVGYELWGDLRL